MVRQQFPKRFGPNKWAIGGQDQEIARFFPGQGAFRRGDGPGGSPAVYRVDDLDARFARRGRDAIPIAASHKENAAWSEAAGRLDGPEEQGFSQQGMKDFRRPRLEPRPLARD